jgi:hypothetical protein
MKMSTSIGRRAALLKGLALGTAPALAMLSGCAVSGPMVDPYTGLLPSGVKLAESNLRLSKDALKQQNVYMVLGANYVNYREMWDKFQKMADDPSVFLRLAYSQAEMQAFQVYWSPQRTTGLVTSMLQQHFRAVNVVNDLAEATDKGAEWIVVFDHAFVQPTTATASWTNTTTIDLLSRSLVRVMRAQVSEAQQRGIAWGSSDVHRLTRQRGDDIVGCITKAVTQFDARIRQVAS